jgi:sulfatase maturation enzyme AslB (radical SAM superfamily)
VLNGETVNIAELELRLGNMCNIGCISCSPLSSNYFIREIEKYQPDLSKFEKKIGYHYSFLKDKEFDWFKDKNFWNTIEKHLPDITYIYLAGGEPTIIKENWEFLERVIELGYSKNIKLGISTNLTNMNKRHIEIYNSFKTCFVYCSIDGVNEVNDYVRYPSKWSQVEKNLQQLISNSNDTVEIKVVPVISILTIWKLPELWNYIEELKNKVNPKVSITSHTLLRDPAWLSLQNLPREGKLKALEIINKMLNEKKVDVEIKKIQKYLESSLDIGNTEEFYQGRQYIEEFEKMRENSWEYAIPELKDLWNKQC